MKKILSMVFLLLASECSTVLCQTVIRQTIGSTGNSLTANGLLVRQTIGQPSSTTVISHDAYILRQGFQQPLSLSGNTPGHRPLPGFTIYPNPASTQTLVTLKDDNCVSFSVTLTGMNGVVLRESTVVNMNHIQLDLTGLAAGSCIITVKTSDNRTSSGLLVVTDHGSH